MLLPVAAVRAAAHSGGVGLKTLICALVLSIFANPATAQDKAWSINAAYTGEIWSAVDGGLSDDARYLDNLDVTLEVDLEDGIG